MKNWEDTQRYELAKKLDEYGEAVAATSDADMDIIETFFDVIDAAISVISPRYMADKGEALEKGMNSPEAKAFAKEATKSPEAQAFIADIERQKRGEIALDYMKKKWGHGGK